MTAAPIHATDIRHPGPDPAGVTAVASQTLADLLEQIERLPEPERGRARERVAAAVDLPAPA